MYYSQNGYLAKDASLIASYTVAGTNVRVNLRRGDVSVVLLYLMAQFDKHVQPLRQKDTGGYNPRSIIGAGSRKVSNHASGTAVDLRWNDHPLGAYGTFSNSQVKAIRTILKSLDGVVRWGHDYSGRKDEMHFEINAPLCKVTAVADKIRNGGKKPAESKPVSVSTVDLKKGSRGPVVKHLQNRLNHVFPAYSRLQEDGDYGPKTEAVIKEFQRRTRLQADGVVGPRTKAVLKRYGITL